MPGNEQPVRCEDRPLSVAESQSHHTAPGVQSGRRGPGTSLVDEDGEVRDRAPVTRPVGDEEGASAVAAGGGPGETPQAPQGLRDSEGRFRAVFETATDAIFIKDADLRFTHVNPAMAQVLGIDRTALIGRSGIEGIDEEAAAQLAEADRRALRGEVSRLAAIRPLPQSDRTFEVRTAPLRDAGGSIVGVCGIAREVTDQVAAERRLAEGERRYRLLADNVADVLWTLDCSERYTYVSPSITRQRGFRPEELLGRSVYEFMSAESVSPVQRAQARARASVEAPDASSRLGEEICEARLLRKDGSYFWAEFRVGPLRDPSGAVIGTIGVTRDVSERRRAEESLRAANGYREKVLGTSLIGFVAIGPDGTIREVNRAFAEIIGHPQEGLSGMSVASSGLPGGSVETAAEMHRLIHQDHHRFEAELRRADGSLVAVEVSATRVDHDGESRIVSFVSDVSERKRAEQLTRRQAYFDALTDLPNRVRFAESSQEALARARRRRGRLALLLCDLDRLKIVNDGFGHTAGDDLLRQLADRLRLQVRSGEVLARLGGDEFALLLPHVGSGREAAAAARRLMGALEEPFSVNGHELHISTSIGISVYPEDGENTETLLKSADAALYHAKDAGRRTFRFHSPAMDARILERIGVEARLRRAIQAGHLVAHYQPVFDLRRGDATTVEALVRWEDPDLGTVMPEKFIEVADETGLIDQIGGVMLETACAQANAWSQIPGLTPPAVSVNLSARQFHDEGLVDAVGEYLLGAGIEGGLLVLEITETAIMGNVHFSLSVLQRLKALGVRLALDDFGKGHSSLAYLKQLPIDYLKIDRGFIAGVPEDPADQAMVAIVISLAHSLGMQAVAEGVESEAQLAFLRQHGCDDAQGFLLARPAPAEWVTALLHRLAVRGKGAAAAHQT
jgi:diguanylate cyclase (GGDEF)-like protein/PAS domain S-box-containing protein